MPTRFTVVCDDDQARAVEMLARRYGITEDEVLQQLVDLGLESLGERPV
ncbi:MULTISPECIES: CopG family transcriptional regulator [Haloarcula]|nr:CopG family transcriptional regulator [Halomicroarcula sp. XH51]